MQKITNKSKKTSVIKSKDVSVNDDEAMCTNEIIEDWDGSIYGIFVWDHRRKMWVKRKF